MSKVEGAEAANPSCEEGGIKLQLSMAVSQAVERECSGSDSILWNDKFVGTSPTVMARVHGVPVRSLLDTVSMVTLVTESFFKDKFESLLSNPHDASKLLKLQGANGLNIPYLGFVTATVEIGGSMIHECGIFIMKDTEATATMQKRVPCLIGTNILRQIPQYKNILHEESKKEKLKTGFVKEGCRGHCNNAEKGALSDWNKHLWTDTPV